MHGIAESHGLEWLIEVGEVGAQLEYLLVEFFVFFLNGLDEPNSDVLALFVHFLDDFFGNVRCRNVDSIKVAFDQVAFFGFVFPVEQLHQQKLAASESYFIQLLHNLGAE